MHYLFFWEQVRDEMINQNDVLKEMNAKAAGEVVIRQALGELDVWEVDARLTLIPHLDSRNNEIMLIKEWKDVINKVRFIGSYSDSDHFKMMVILVC